MKKYIQMTPSDKYDLVIKSDDRAMARCMIGLFDDFIAHPNMYSENTILGGLVRPYVDKNHHVLHTRLWGSKEEFERLFDKK